MIHFLVKLKIVSKRQRFNESSHNELNMLWHEGGRGEYDIRKRNCLSRRYIKKKNIVTDISTARQWDAFLWKRICGK
jgi:hypothetical protein